MLVLYVLNGCPYCNSALQEVKQHGIPHRKVVVPPHDKQRYKTMNGMNTFPQIFVEKNGSRKLLGGYTDLMQRLQ